jgi:hypothetical protein
VVSIGAGLIAERVAATYGRMNSLCFICRERIED